MKKVLSLSLFVSIISFMAAGLGHADTRPVQPNVTRIVITGSSSIEYQHNQKTNPPRLEIKFLSKNIFAQLEEEIHVNRGLIEYISTRYYGKKGQGRAIPLQSLTFYLIKKTPYKIIDADNMIIIEIETPPEIFVQELSLGRPGVLEITNLEKLGEEERALLNGIVQGELKLREEEIKSKESPIYPLEAEALETFKQIENILSKEMPPPQFFESKAEEREKMIQDDVRKAPPVPRAAGHRRPSIKLISILLIFLAIFCAGSYMVWQKRIKDMAVKTIELQRPWESVKRNLVTHLDPRSPMAESYRSLRTNILSMGRDKPFKSLLITSAIPHEGKTTVAVNLAVTLANMGSKVLLVDSALRQPLINKIFDLELAPGLTDVLTKGLYWTEVINTTNIENLSIITSGRLPHNPSEILGSKRMSDLVEKFKSQFDFVLFDSHDVISITDSVILGSKVDSALLVVRSRKTQRETVLRAQTMLEGAKVNILGYVLSVVNTAIPKKFNGFFEHLGQTL